jgi:hypothetical protein
VTKQQNDGFGFDDPVDPKEPERTLLPEGKATFTVLDWKRSRGECGKYGTHNVAKILLLVVAEDGTEAELEENVWLIKALTWKYLQFFTAIGQRQHGDEGEFIPKWNEVKDSVGACEIEHRKYINKKGKEVTAHQIKAFLAPEESGDIPF